MKIRRRSLLRRTSQRIKSSLSKTGSVDSARSVKTKIEDDEEKASWPQTIIFPEGSKQNKKKLHILILDFKACEFKIYHKLSFIGTVTNGQAVIKFKSGAFYPGVPVQPMLLRPRSVKDSSSPSGYRQEGLDTLTWTMYQNWSPLQCMWFTLCQFNSNFVVSFLGHIHFLFKNNINEIQ